MQVRRRTTLLLCDDNSLDLATLHFACQPRVGMPAGMGRLGHKPQPLQDLRP